MWGRRFKGQALNWPCCHVVPSCGRCGLGVWGVLMAMWVGGRTAGMERIPYPNGFEEHRFALRRRPHARSSASHGTHQ